MPQKERLRVWRNELKKTSGGLTRDQLTKNKRGKIVSRKKSAQAVGDANNLGSWLRGKGDQFAGKPKAFKQDEKEEEKQGEVPAKKTKVKQAAPKKAPAPVKQAPKKKKKLEPMMPGEKKSAKISVGNIVVKNTKVQSKEDSEAAARRVMKGLGMSDAEIDEALSGGRLSLAGKVRRVLKASKRRGKRRTKKQLLQDVLDL